MYIFIINRTETDLLFHAGDGIFKLLKINERKSVLCSEQGTTNLQFKHIHGSSICKLQCKNGLERFANNLSLNLQKEYHMAISSAYSFSKLNDMDEIEITHKTLIQEDYVSIECFIAKCNNGTIISMLHEVENGEYIKRIYKKNLRKMALWHFALGFLLDFGFFSVGIWILIALTNIIENPDELPFWVAIVGFFFILTLIPNLIWIIKEYRNNKIISYMSTQKISEYIFN